jgi:hypothetical protein
MNVLKIQNFERNTIDHSAKTLQSSLKPHVSNLTKSKELNKVYKLQKSTRREAYQDIMHITLEKFKINKQFQETIVRSHLSQNISSDRIKISSEDPFLKFKRTSFDKDKIWRNRNTRSQHLFMNERTLATDNKFMSQANLNILTEKLQVSKQNSGACTNHLFWNKDGTHQAFPIVSSFILPPRDEFKEPIKEAHLGTFGHPSVRIRQDSKSHIKANQANFNDFYSVPFKGKNETKTTEGAGNSKLLHFKQITRKLMEDNKSLRSETKIRTSQTLAADLKMMCQSFFDIKNKRNLSKQSFFHIQNSISRQELNDNPNESKNKKTKINRLHSERSRMNKSGTQKNSFIEFSKKNMNFSSYFNKLEKKDQEVIKMQITLTSMAEKEINFIMATNFNKDTYLPEIGQNSESSDDNIDTVVLLQKIVLTEKFSLERLGLLTTLCPMSIQHRYPRIIKPPYVYEYSQNCHYSSYWIDCITRLYDMKSIEDGDEYGYYCLQDHPIKDFSEFDEVQTKVLILLDRVAFDINCEHQINKNLENQTLA